LTISYDKDHDSDGEVLFFYFLQDFSGATREASVLAEEALHPMKLGFQISIQMVKSL
jgi:hypothetical protein